MTVFIWFVLASALVNIIGALIMNTKDFPSAIIFKVIPFFAGFGALIYWLQQVGVL